MEGSRSAGAVRIGVDLGARKIALPSDHLPKRDVCLLRSQPKIATGTQDSHSPIASAIE